MNTDIEEYYRKRAPEYEDIYTINDPVRQMEQKNFAEAIKAALGGRNVLEVAAGTGYWTQFLSETAKSVTATDVSEETLKIARTKKYQCPVSFKIEDAYNLSFRPKSFDGGMVNMWLSHVPKDRIDAFLRGFHKALKPSSKVFIGDNLFIEGLGRKNTIREGDENTYNLRKLKDGSEFIVLKNYFTAEDLIKIFSGHVSNFSNGNVFCGKHFWYVIYTPD